MKYFRHSSDGDVHIYPLVCMHLGVEESDDDFLQRHIERIAADSKGVAVYMGDAGDCSILNSKGDVYRQYLTPGEQLDAATELMEPIQEKLLFGISGNHGRRITRNTGVDWDSVLCSKLGIPYLGYSVLARFDVDDLKYDAFFHHGCTSSITAGGKIAAAAKFNQLIEADAVFTAHSHICTEVPVSTIATIPTTARRIEWRYKHSYVCGCGYDSRTGYAEEKGYPPILPGYLRVELRASQRHDLPYHARKNQVCVVYRGEL